MRFCSNLGSILSVYVLDLDKPKQASEYLQDGESIIKGHPERETKQIRVGGFFGKTFTVKKVGDKLVYERIKKSSNSQLEKIEQVNEKTKYWKPSNNQITKEKNRIKICPLCGYQTNVDEKKCLKCGHDF